MDAVLAVRRNDSPAILAASSRFGKFGKEPIHEVRMQKVEMNPALEAMKKAWSDCIFHPQELQRDYNEITGKIQDLRYSAKDVEAICFLLAEYQNEANFSQNSGLFLSVLMNHCDEDDFIIHTAHLAEAFHLIGFHNTKNITIEGDAGIAVGFMMRCGTITVKGKAKDFVGNMMAGGEIIVNGDAGSSVGANMESGTITVTGDAGDFVGADMTGGSITVMGDAGERVGDGMRFGRIDINGAYESMAVNFPRGMIFHKGKLVRKK